MNNKKNIMFFCIPAHGHTNPMLPVAAELVKRGNRVNFYSFNDFRGKIEKTGAAFIPCDKYLPELSEKEELRLKQVSTTEMTIQDLRITLNMDGFLEKEVEAFKPDVIFSDSVCFWGKLTANKYDIPMVCSTSTFAFNQFSSKYMKHSAGEMADMVFGLSKVSKELKKMEKYGYRIKSALDLVQNDYLTDTVVYTSKDYQPFSESFSEHYAFVGPSVFSDLEPVKSKDRPLIYISLGTVINDRPDFYLNCVKALCGLNVEIVISCGQNMDMKSLGELPENVKVYPYVNQLEMLSRASLFITHCGMNSVSESLYMACPMVLYPQTGEQAAVARRAEETGAGVLLKDDSCEAIKNAVEKILGDEAYADAARSRCRDFRSCSGAEGAAEFIENAPHVFEKDSSYVDVNKAMGRFISMYWTIAMIILVLVGIFIGWKYAWIVGVPAGILSFPLQKLYIKRISKQ